MQRALLAVLALATLQAGADGTTPPRAVFALTQTSGPVETLLDRAEIDGVALQIGWESLEPADDRFEWSSLDSALSAAQSRSKSVTLHVFAGGLRVAPWLVTAGAQTYQWIDGTGRAREDLVPWDEIFLGEFAEFLQALASHLEHTGDIQAVARLSVAVPVAEMDLPACRDGRLAGQYPYDRAVYLAAWARMLEAFQTWFPSTKKFISAPVGLICFPVRDEEFFREVMERAVHTGGTMFVPFAADLTAEGSTRMQAYRDLVPSLGLGYQTIWSATNDPANRMKGTYPDNLRVAVCTALAQGAGYLELYAVDVMNPDPAIQHGVTAAHHPELCPGTRRQRPVRR